MNTIDTRDLYERKQELEEFKTALKEARKALEAHKEEKPEEDSEEWEEELNGLEIALDDAELDFGDEEEKELEELEELENTITDFRHGETMIEVDDFEDYARELAEDIGAVGWDLKWPLNNIDWEAAADELAQDYTVVEYQGEEYYVRAW